MAYQIEKFIENVSQVHELDTLCKLYNKSVEQLGFDQVIYSFVTDHHNAGIKAEHGLYCTFNQSWMKHYSSQNYSEIDPVIKEVQQSSYIFDWDNLHKQEAFNKNQKRVLDEAKDAGLLSGVAIPLHGPRGELAGIGLASDNSRNVLSEMDKAILYSISKHFHLNYCKLSSKDKKFIPSSITLTNRETEILKWWASGKTSDEIATILSCSQSNIKWHIKNIYEKLDANEKVLAITKAIRLGLILSSPYR